jgi:hypothetical protein
MQYNPKIDTEGNYLPFYGWSVISMVKSDLKIIENIIKQNSVLNNYFSALPSSSYHMTVYNIWANRSQLISHQLKNLINSYDVEMIDIFKKNSEIGFFNPNGCINDLLYKLQYYCKDTWDQITFKIDAVEFTGNTLQIILKKSPSFNNVDKVRNKMKQIVEKNDNMKKYHITLAYKYKDIDLIDKDKIIEEISIFNRLLKDQTVTIKTPFVCYFSSMKLFEPFENHLDSP